MSWPAAGLGFVLALGLNVPPASAGEADVMGVKAQCTAIRTCDFDASVRHADIGFSHYADRFEVVAPDGEVLGIRVLQHPHVHEQPFTRRLVGVEIPEGVSEVTVRAHDSEHGFGGRIVTLQLEFPAPAPAPPTTGMSGQKAQGAALDAQE